MDEATAVEKIEKRTKFLSLEFKLSRVLKVVLPIVVLAVGIIWVPTSVSYTHLTLPTKA